MGFGKLKPSERVFTDFVPIVSGSFPIEFIFIN